MRIPSSRLLKLSGLLKGTMLASVGVLALGAPVSAQETAVASAAATDKAEAATLDETVGGLGDIVVTARRRAENVQDVPMAMSVVTSADIINFNVTSFNDVSKLAPGLNIRSASGPGTEPSIILRGVRWTDASGSPAVPLYTNEISFDPAVVMQSMFDIGQIEVLLGPQGTTRGAPSISGAVTLTTQKPDLYDIGGYVYGQFGSENHQNAQMALNIPIVPGKLAVRLAGMAEHSRGNDVFSLNNPKEPTVSTRTGRITALFEPTENLGFQAMYQFSSVQNDSYLQVAGTGSLGKTVNAALPPAFGGKPPLVLPANYNGPAIAADDYLSVQDINNRVNDANIQLFTFNAHWDVLGQRLSFNYGQQRNEGSGVANNDLGNTFIGWDPVSTTHANVDPRNWTIEARLSSIRGGDKFWDYDIGYYHSEAHSAQPTSYDQIAAYVPGAFGAPLFNPSSPYINVAAVQRYSVPLNLQIELSQTTSSFYGNLQLHLPWDIEFSGGVRFIDDTRPITTIGKTGTAHVALPVGLPPAFGGCPAPGVLPPSPIYGPAYCDVTVPGATVVNDVYDETNKPTLYIISVSKQFNQDFLGYFTTGTSYRTGVGNIATYVTDPNLTQAKPEYATSYEVGLKSTWWDRKLRFNVDIFQINYTDQLTQAPNIQYLDVISTPGKPTVKTTSRAFFQNLDSRVRGIEAEFAVAPARGLDFAVNMSYAKIQSQGGLFPCNDPTRPLTPGNVMNFCNVPAGDTINSSAPFQMNITGNYVHPLTGDLNGYVRFLAYHAGSNPNFGYDLEAKAYTLVDLFVGVTGTPGAWDLGFYAKNVFDTHTQLTSLKIVPPVPDFGDSGYSLITTTLPREIGVSLRYAFGSH